MTPHPLVLVTAASLLCAAPGTAQNTNYLRPLPEIEARLDTLPFQFIDVHGTRFHGDQTMRVAMAYPDSVVLAAKLKPAPGGGDEEFNNKPRYEVAAYELQKLFLPPMDFVVPPTTLRALPLSMARQLDPLLEPTFEGTQSVVVELQYWLNSVTPKGFYDRARLRRDTLYERYLANMNIFTYLIRHADSNQGNFLVSQDSTMPHVYSVDNGVSFLSSPSERGYVWRDLLVDRLPRATIERLRAITRADLDRVLGVVAQFTLGPDQQLVPAAPGPNLNLKRGVRRSDNLIQFGLTKNEIDGVQDRLRSLLKRVDEGKLKQF